MTSPSRSWCFALLIQGLLPALPAAAQEPDSPASTFGERLEVNVVEVEVYATDGSGRAVTDLSTADFVVRVDGRPVEVTGFYASGASGLPAEGTDPMPEPQLSEPAPAAPPPAPGSGVSLVVYVENAYLDPRQRRLSLEAVGEFLTEHLRPSDRAMVVNHDLGLEILQPFTADIGRVQSAMSGLSKAAARGVHDRLEREAILREIEAIDDDTDCQVIRASVVSRVQGLYAEAHVSLGALRSLVGSIAGVEGRKMLLYVGAGPPLRPGEDLLEILAEVCPGTPFDALEFDLADEIHALATEANTAGVTIHALDAGGLRGRVGSTVTSRIPLYTPRTEQLLVANVHDTFFALADQTGGRAILNANDPRPDLGRVGEDLESFYSLAFDDPHGRDGRAHRVQVRVERPGVVLRYRGSYRSQPVTEELAQSTLAALFYGEGELVAGGRLVPGEPRLEKGAILVPIQVDLPFAGILLLPGDEGLLVGQLRLFVALRDTQGRVTKVHEAPVPIRISREEHPAGPPDRLRYPLTLTVAPGEQTLAVTVWDELGGTSGVLSLVLDLEKRRGRAYFRTKS